MSAPPLSNGGDGVRMALVYSDGCDASLSTLASSPPPTASQLVNDSTPSSPGVCLADEGDSCPLPSLRGGRGRRLLVPRLPIPPSLGFPRSPPWPPSPLPSHPSAPLPGHPSLPPSAPPAAPRSARGCPGCPRTPATSAGRTCPRPHPPRQVQRRPLRQKVQPPLPLLLLQL